MRMKTAKGSSSRVMVDRYLGVPIAGVAPDHAIIVVLAQTGLGSLGAHGLACGDIHLDVPR
jgi:hypothetical protein